MYGPTGAPRNDSPKGSQKELKRIWTGMSKSKSLFLDRLKVLGGMGICGMAMVTAPRMQNIMGIHKKNILS